MPQTADFWETLTVDDLPGDLREIGQALGMDVVRYLVEYWGGTQIYVPSASTLQKKWRDDQIRELWNGRNEGQLARQFEVTRRYIYDVLKGDKAGIEDPGQADLFTSEKG